MPCGWSGDDWRQSSPERGVRVSTDILKLRVGGIAGPSSCCPAGYRESVEVLILPSGRCTTEVRYVRNNIGLWTFSVNC
jgi:hypothetical protein